MELNKKIDQILTLNNDICMEEKRYRKGDYILHQGDQLTKLYILIEGSVKINHTTVNGNRLLCAITSAFNILGEVEFLHDFIIHNDVIAIEDCCCLSISAKYKERLLNDVKFMRFIAERTTLKLRNMNLNASVSTNYPVENRLAAYLLSCHHEKMINENMIDVAEMIGSSYRQLQRVLRYFIKQEYMKKIDKGKYMILDFKSLQELGKDLYHI